MIFHLGSSSSCERSRAALVAVCALASAAAGRAQAPPLAANDDDAPCVTALPHVAALSRTTVSSRCPAQVDALHDGDILTIGARGHVRFDTRIDDRHALEVTCVGGGAPVAVHVGGSEPPWFDPTTPDVACGAWTANERTCVTAAGDEVLVCGATTRAIRAVDLARDARPLGLPTWYVGELPAVVDDDPAPTPPADAAASRNNTGHRVLRVVVTPLLHPGLEDRLAIIVTASLTAELRKLSGLSVVGTDEVRAMLDVEGERQLAGCTDDGCLAEIAAALGVDVLIAGEVSALGDERLFTLRRIDERSAQVHGQVNQRLAAGNGEELLAAVGPAIEALFPDQPLKPGASRGVADELALRLHPPPLSPWVFYTGLGVTSATFIGSGVASTIFLTTYQRYDTLRTRDAAPGVIVVPLQKDAATWGTVAITASVVTLALGAATVGSAALVDWQGLGDDVHLEAVR